MPYNPKQLPSGQDDEIVEPDWVKDVVNLSDFFPLVFVVLVIGGCALLMPALKEIFLIIVSMIYCILGGC